VLPPSFAKISFCAGIAPLGEHVHKVTMWLLLSFPPPVVRRQNARKSMRKEFSLPNGSFNQLSAGQLNSLSLGMYCHWGNMVELTSTLIAVWLIRHLVCWTFSFTGFYKMVCFKEFWVITDFFYLDKKNIWQLYTSTYDSYIRNLSETTCTQYSFVQKPHI